MKSLVLVSVLLYYNTSVAQEKVDASLFDFWVGTWQATWKNADGSTSKGNNKISKILSGKALQENFSDETGFEGTSISVFNPANNTWHQSWVDSQGSHFDMEGGIDHGRPFFRTRTLDVNGKPVIKRMIFYNIQPDSFTWDWEQSEDNGKSWSLLWRIFYTRNKN